MKKSVLSTLFFCTFSISGICQITDTGDEVGIGITTPQEKLELKGNLLIRDPSNNTGISLSPSITGYGADPEFIIQSAEIGTGANAPFHISRNAFFQTSDDNYYRIDDSYGATSILFNNNGDIDFRQVNAGSGNISWESRMIIDGSNGRIGIGTLAPNEKLDINGNIRLTGLDREIRWQGNNMDIGSYEDVIPVLALRGATSYSTRIDMYKAGDTEVGIKLNSGGDSYFNGGYVGIGTINPQSLLAVNGIITAKEVNVTMDAWPDYVFSPEYTLPSISELKGYIEKNSHLPGIPSAKEVSKTGINLGEMDAKLLQKIEELTLYIIDQNKRIEELEKQNSYLISAIKKTD